jgi:hypothetical protein
MNIPDNIGWLEDLAVHSLEHGHADQASKLWAISKWIADADELMGQQNTLMHEIKERADALYRENEYLQNRLMRFGA